MVESLSTRKVDAVVVAGSGAIAVDRILFLDRGFAEGKGKVLGQEVTHGGNVATALAAVARLGGGASWLGYLPEGSVRADLSSYGINVESATPTDTPPIQSTILVDPAGERFIAFDDETRLGMPEATTRQQAAELLRGVDALLVDSYTARNGLPLVVQAIEMHVPVIADLERIDFPGALELFDMAPHLVIPLEVGQSVTGHTLPAKVLQELWSSHRTAVVLTDGSRGSWFATAAGTQHEQAFTVDVVDTNGCGDVFHGAYALRIAQGCSVHDAIRHASAAGAVCATGAGGRGHLPTQDDLKALLDPSSTQALSDLRN